MPSLEASSSTASSDDQPVARAMRRPAMNEGRAAGMVNRHRRRWAGRRSAAATSRRRGWASRTPTRVCRVTGTATALNSTTSLSASPMPNSSMNSGIQARVGICARAAKVGSTSRSARALAPSQAPSSAPPDTPASRPRASRCRLIDRLNHRSPWASSTALCQTSAGAGRICADIQPCRLASHQSSARPVGSSQGSNARLRCQDGREGRQATETRGVQVRAIGKEASSARGLLIFLWGIKNLCLCVYLDKQGFNGPSLAPANAFFEYFLCRAGICGVAGVRAGLSLLVTKK
ncbi:hypothetical protein D9M70_349080 [compost metagenome]